MTALDIAKEYQIVLEMLQDPDAEFEVIQDTLEAIEGELEVKAESIGVVLEELSASEDKLTKIIERLTTRKKAITSNKENLKRYFESVMRVAGKTKIKTDLYTFSIQKNPPSLKINEDLDWDQIPVEFIKYSDPQINKTALKDAIKAGQEFSWAHMVQTEGLRVR